MTAFSTDFWGVIYVTDIQEQHEVGRAHAEVFREHPPVATMVEVKGLVDPEMRVELEVEAYSPQ